MNLTKSERIQIAAALGMQLAAKDEKYQTALEKAYAHNRWFIEANVNKATDAICRQFLSPEKLENWAAEYPITDSPSKKIGIILAGNIPLVGFHDFLSVFISGNFVMLKLASRDKILMEYLLDTLVSIDARVADYFDIVERLENFDAVIATGSNNSSRYFEYYFGKFPNIIRKNRNGVAVLTGNESEHDFRNLGADVFDFFGLGCRNVTQIFVPRGYKFDKLLEVFDEDEEIKWHNKYKNNFDYNYTLYLLNKEKFLANNTIILREDPSYISRIACLHYMYYDTQKKLEQRIISDANLIQCVSTRSGDLFDLENEVSFGSSQQPGLMDYADGVDTMAFLTQLS